MSFYWVFKYWVKVRVGLKINENCDKAIIYLKIWVKNSESKKKINIQIQKN